MRHTFSEEHSVQGRTQNRKLSEQGEWARGRERKGRRDQKWWYSFSSSSPKLWTRRPTMNPRLYLRGTSPKHCRARGSSAPPLGNDVCKRQYLRSIASENSPPSLPRQHLRTGCQGLPDHWAFRSFQFPILNFQEFSPNFYFFTITFREAAPSKNLGGPVVMWWA